MDNYHAAQIQKQNKVHPSKIKDLIKFLSGIKDDLANITAPPSFLAPCSVVENPQCWAERPAIFVAPALEESAVKRSLSVLRMFLIGLRRQYYIGGGPGISIKKPLNAFLGEVYLSSWTADMNDHKPATVKLVSEQVSHHPPITAMYIASDTYGIRAHGYARVEMKFSGMLKIRQIGHTALHIDKFDEDYLLPLPAVQVRGFLSACLYPEISGIYHIPSTSGYITEINFTGSGVFRGQTNKFEAKIYREQDKTHAPIYKVDGTWSQGWTVVDCSTGEILESYNVEEEDAKLNARRGETEEGIEQQDDWETHKAWHKVLQGIREGNTETIIKEKSVVEQAQREMRKEEMAKGEKWQPLLFQNSLRSDDYKVFNLLGKVGNMELHSDETLGIWRIDSEALENLQKPYRPGVTPLGYIRN
ncbi:hypothetical protein NW762_013929 [Fusarium torreyae]|uniref:Oxysterol-binding protein n=1 Tax=Fusarium torreyae TaxID=1237075 RepID=A0A9W8RMV3_9HYPO|nr:hypothetical protein NW762_013929 [Fusarium torreyae]